MLHIMFGKLNQYLSQDVCKPVLLSLNIVRCIVVLEVGKGEMAALTLTHLFLGSTSLINTHVLSVAQAASPDPCRGSNRITSAVMTVSLYLGSVSAASACHVIWPGCCSAVCWWWWPSRIVNSVRGRAAARCSRLHTDTHITRRLLLSLYLLLYQVDNCHYRNLSLFSFDYWGW